MKLLFAMAFVLIAFAGNSFLARLAMATQLIDPVSFTTIRIVSGALMLLIFVPVGQAFRQRSWSAAALLAIYAVANTIAFVKLATGTGALALFAMVQVTMILLALQRGESLSWLTWLGMTLAIIGLAGFLLPKASTDNAAYILAAIVAGITWGGYSAARQQASPVVATAANFLLAACLLLLGQIMLTPWLAYHWQPLGVVYALASGMLTSALGYVVWYWVVRRIAGSLAATVQLFAPVMAALLGWLVLAEQLSVASLFAGLVILLGIVMVASQRRS